MLANPKRTKDEIVQWIREYFAANGNDCCAVIGISGGKDSSVVAALCVEALGVERVIGVLMPNGWQKDIADSKLLVDTLGIASVTVDIGGAYSKMVDVVGRVMPSSVSNQAAVNLPPRLRMATLYMVAQSLARGGRVANTCNRSEDYVGYSTKFGDSAGDFSPLANIMVHEVRQIGYELPIPRELVDKTPSTVNFTDISVDDETAAAIQKKVTAQQELELANIEKQTAKVQAEKDREVAQINAEKAVIEAEAKAEAMRIAAEAEADANRKIAASLTDELIEKIKYEQWNGELPTVTGSTSIVSIEP